MHRSVSAQVTKTAFTTACHHFKALVCQTQNSNVSRPKDVDCLCPELRVTNVDHPTPRASPNKESCAILAQEHSSRYLLYCRRNSELRQKTVSRFCVRKYSSVNGKCERNYWTDCYTECDAPLNKCPSFQDGLQKFDHCWNDLIPNCHPSQIHLNLQFCGTDQRRSKSADLDNSVSEVTKPSVSASTLEMASRHVVSSPGDRLSEEHLSYPHLPRGRTFSHGEPGHKTDRNLTIKHRESSLNIQPEHRSRPHSLPPRVSRTPDSQALASKREIPTLIYHPVPTRKPGERPVSGSHRLAGKYEVFYPSTATVGGVFEPLKPSIPGRSSTTKSRPSIPSIQRRNSVGTVIGDREKPVPRGERMSKFRPASEHRGRSSRASTKPTSSQPSGNKLQSGPSTRTAPVKSSRFSRKPSTKPTYVPPLIHQSIPSMKLSNEEECSELIQHATAAILSSPAVYTWGSVYLPKDSIFPAINQPPPQMLSSLSRSTVPDDDDDDGLGETDGSDIGNLDGHDSNGKEASLRRRNDTGPDNSFGGKVKIPEGRQQTVHQGLIMDDATHSSDHSEKWNSEPFGSSSKEVESSTKDSKKLQPQVATLKGPGDCRNMCVLEVQTDTSSISPYMAPNSLDKGTLNEGPPMQSDRGESYRSTYTGDEYNSTTIPPTEIMDSTWKPVTTESKTPPSPASYRLSYTRGVEEDDLISPIYPGVPSADAHRVLGTSSPNFDEIQVHPFAYERATPVQCRISSRPERTSDSQVPPPRSRHQLKKQTIHKAKVQSTPIEPEQAEPLSDSVSSSSSEELQSTTIPPTEMGENTIPSKPGTRESWSLTVPIKPQSNKPRLYNRNVEEEEEFTDGKYPGMPSANTHRVQGASSPTRSDASPKPPVGINLSRPHLAAVEYSALSDEPTDTLPWDRSVFSSHDVFLLSDTEKATSSDVQSLRRSSQVTKLPCLKSPQTIKQIEQTAGVGSIKNGAKNLSQLRLSQSSSSTMERHSVKSFSFAQQTREKLLDNKSIVKQQESTKVDRNVRLSLYSVKRPSKEISPAKFSSTSGESSGSRIQRRATLGKMEDISKKSASMTGSIRRQTSLSRSSDPSRKSMMGSDSTTETPKSSAKSQIRIPEHLSTGDDTPSKKHQLEKLRSPKITSSSLDSLMKAPKDGISEGIQHTIRASILKHTADADDSGHRSVGSNGSHVSQTDKEHLNSIKDIRTDIGFDEELLTEGSTKVTGAHLTDWDDCSFSEAATQRSGQEPMDSVTEKQIKHDMSDRDPSKEDLHEVMKPKVNEVLTSTPLTGRNSKLDTSEGGIIPSIYSQALHPESHQALFGDADQKLRNIDTLTVRSPAKSLPAEPQNENLSPKSRCSTVLSREHCLCRLNAPQKDVSHATMNESIMKVSSKGQKEMSVRPAGESSEKSARPPLVVPERRLSELRMRKSTSNESSVLRSISRGVLSRNVATILTSQQTGDSGQSNRPSVQSTRVRPLDRSRTSDSTPCTSLDRICPSVHEWDDPRDIHCVPEEMSQQGYHGRHVPTPPIRSQSCVLSHSPDIIRSMSSDLSCFPSSRCSMNPGDFATYIPYIESHFSLPANSVPINQGQCDCSSTCQRIRAVVKRSSSTLKQRSSDREWETMSDNGSRDSRLPIGPYPTGGCACTEEEVEDDASGADDDYTLQGCGAYHHCDCHPCFEQDILVITKPGNCTTGHPNCLCKSSHTPLLFNHHQMQGTNCPCLANSIQPRSSSYSSINFADSDDGINQCALTNSVVHNSSGSNICKQVDDLRMFPMHWSTYLLRQDHIQHDPITDEQRHLYLTPDNEQSFHGNNSNLRCGDYGIASDSKNLRISGEDVTTKPKSSRPERPEQNLPNGDNHRNPMDCRRSHNGDDYSGRARSMRNLKLHKYTPIGFRSAKLDKRGHPLGVRYPPKFANHIVKLSRSLTFVERISVCDTEHSDLCESNPTDVYNEVSESSRTGLSRSGNSPSYSDEQAKIVRGDETVESDRSEIRTKPSFPSGNLIMEHTNRNSSRYKTIQNVLLSSEKVTPEAHQILNTIRDNIDMLTQDLIALDQQIPSHNFRTCEAIVEHLVLLPQMYSTLMDHLQYSPLEKNLERKIAALNKLINQVAEDPVTVFPHLLELTYRLCEISSILGENLVSIDLAKLIHSIQVKLQKFKVGYVVRQYFHVPEAAYDLITPYAKSRSLFRLEDRCGCKVNVLHPDDPRSAYCPVAYRTIEVVYDEKLGKPHLFQPRLEYAINPRRSSVRHVATIVRQIDGQECSMQPEAVKELLDSVVRPRYCDVRALIASAAVR